jgi:hypothetical protein
MSRRFMSIVIVVTVMVGVMEGRAALAQRAATVPFTLDHNRLMVDVQFLRSDGTIRTAQAWLDTGNERLVLGRKLATDLGLAVGAPDEQRHEVPTPRVCVGTLELDVEGVTTTVQPASVTVRPGVTAEACLPASALRHRQVVLDYPARTLTVGMPGALKPRGVPIPCLVNEQTGLFQVAALIDGETVRLGVDSGSAGTWVSGTLIERWQARHPRWPSAVGALGSTNFWGLPFEPGGVLMSLPELGLGRLHVRDVALLGLDQGLFDWYSKKSAGPVAGFIGANVLRRFRVEVDYPNRMTYWEDGPREESRDLDIVGLTVRQEGDGTYTVAGVATKDGKATVDGVRAGDTLLRVGSLVTAGVPMGLVVDALRGTPGETRMLALERDGTRFTAEATVRRFP